MLELFSSKENFEKKIKIFKRNVISKEKKRWQESWSPIFQPIIVNLLEQRKEDLVIHGTSNFVMRIFKAYILFPIFIFILKVVYDSYYK